MAIIQVWSAPRCQAGAICYGAIPWLSAVGSEAQGTAPAFRCTTSREGADATSLAEGRLLRVLSQSRGEQWWFVTQVADSDGDPGVVQVTAGSLKPLLGARGLVRVGATYETTPGRLSVSDLITEHVLTNLADDSLSWLSIGTVDSVETFDFGTLKKVNRATVLDTVEQVTGHTVVLRGLYTGAVLTGFAIDVLSDPAAALDTVPLSSGSGLTTLQRTRDVLRAASVVIPFDARDGTLEQTTWKCTGTIGTSPAWVLLRDPVTGNPWPIQEDDQFIGAYLIEQDGTATQIIDSRASDSAVQVASAGTISASAELTLARDSAGRPVVEITSPAAIAGSRGRLVATTQTTKPHSARNLITNGLMKRWSFLDAPETWTSVASCLVDEYPRDTPLTWTALVNGAVSSGAAGFNYDGATPFSRLFQNEQVQFNGAGTLYPLNVMIANNFGAGAATFSGTTAPTLADNSTIALASSTRPVSFPVERYQNAMMRFGTNDVSTPIATLTSKMHMRSPVIRVATAVGTQINVRAGFSYRNVSGTAVQNRDFSNNSTTVRADVVFLQMPGVMLYNSATSALLDWRTPTEIPATSTVHETLTSTVTVGADTSVRVGLFAGAASKLTLFAACRWVTMWLGDDVPQDDIWVGSRSNAGFHRAQDVLAGAARGTRYTATGVDLKHLTDGTAPLALGQMVRLRSDRLGVDATVRIVKLDYRFDATETLNLELGTITPRLTGVTFDL